MEAIWCQDGKHWSSRIWTNKSALQEKIKNGLVDCVARGVSKEELVKELMNDMNVGYYEAQRIARTELTFI
jgi:NAD+--asparagine ADP-ribosyltransferase